MPPRIIRISARSSSAIPFVRRDHLEAMGIRGLRIAINILQHAAEPPTGWTSAVDIQGAGQIILTSERIDKMIAARDLATRGERAMLAARLRVPEGTTFIEERSRPRVRARPRS